MAGMAEGAEKCRGQVTGGGKAASFANRGSMLVTGTLNVSRSVYCGVWGSAGVFPVRMSVMALFTSEPRICSGCDKEKYPAIQTDNGETYCLDCWKEKWSVWWHTDGRQHYLREYNERYTHEGKH